MLLEPWTLLSTVVLRLNHGVPGTEREPGEEHMGLKDEVSESQNGRAGPWHRDLTGRGKKSAHKLRDMVRNHFQTPFVTAKVSMLTSGKVDLSATSWETAP